MPDRTYTRGAVLFEINFASDQMLTPEERIYDVSCAPPPGGTIARYNPPTQASPVFQPGYFQQAERDRLLVFAANAGETLALDALLAALGTACGFQTLTIDLSQIPAGWEAPVPCFDTSIRCAVHWSTREVTAKCTRDVTHGTETFPSGDTVATFRISNPSSYQFVRRHTWNPQCCSGTATTRGEDRSDIFPRTEYILPDSWKLDLFPKWKWSITPVPPAPGGDSGEGH